jgi:thymidylate synthase
VYYYKNKLAIGKNNGKNLLCYIKEDIELFKKLTTNNIIVMGSSTYFSLKKKPLVDRLHIILTKNKILLKTNSLESVKDKMKFANNGVVFLSPENLINIRNFTKREIFVIGGSQIFNLFLCDYNFFINKIYFSEIKDYDVERNGEPDRFINLDDFTSNFKLISVTEKERFRFLIYKNTHTQSQEDLYLNLMRNILDNGNDRGDRTGTGTRSIFSEKMTFDISSSIPMITTKRVSFKIIIEELLWFLRGDTNSKLLEDKKINIWKGNSSKEFIKNKGLDYKEGVIGAGYGWQWRFFGAEYDEKYSDTSKILPEDRKLIGGFDQIEYVINELKTNPYSRRIFLSAWNPLQMKEMVLPPCHISIQFYVEEVKGVKYLSSQFYMRSNDVFLANCINVVSYTVLTYILALKCDMVPKNITYVCGDCHIYKNHIEQVKTQLARKSRPLPRLVLDKSIKDKPFEEITFADFNLIGYFPDTIIRAPMAI